MLPSLTRLLVAAAVLCAACDEKRLVGSGPPAPSAAPSGLSALGLDAGILDAVDPPAPAGDLKAELDRFVNIDTCVAERAKIDPLVGDALNAIGYETFLRDACRLLEAAKDRRRETCDKIDASALRSRCQAWVAMIAQTPDACPLQFEGLVTRGRNASCVAVAARDPRLCVGEARTVQRGTCEALVRRDASRCDALLPAQRASCQREAARWRTVLSPPLEGLEPPGDARAKLVVHGTGGTPDPVMPEVDLATDFVRGIVVVTQSRRARLELGTLVESEATRIAAIPQKRPRVGLAVIVDEAPSSGAGRAAPARTSIQKLELELPAEATIVAPPGTCDCTVTMTKTPRRRGDAVAFVLDGTLMSNGRSYKIRLDLASFARDLVEEIPGTRVLPALPLSIRDGGPVPR